MEDQSQRVKSSIFIFFEFIGGLGFGILAVQIYAALSFGGNLLDSVSKQFMILFSSMLAGVVLVGYFHYRAMHMLAAFARAIASCTIGLITGAIAYLFVSSMLSKELPGLLDYVLPIVLPLTGAVIGFNLATINKPNSPPDNTEK